MGCVSSKYILADNTSTTVYSRQNRSSKRTDLPSCPSSSPSLLPAYPTDMKLDFSTEKEPVLEEPEGINHPKAALRKSYVEQLSKDFGADLKSRMVQNATHSLDFTTLITNRDVLARDTHVFNTKIPFECPVTDQKNSGRCWIFAALNVFRLEIMAKYKLDELELSQGYLFFWDKFEKCNWFLECMIDLRDRDVNDRVVQHMLKLPVNDAGQWDMLVNLVERYGVVPKYLYPETFSSSNTDNLNKLVLAKLRDHAVVLRRMAAQGHSLEDLRREKEASLKEIYTILCITLGEPPKGTFTWSFRNKDKKYYEFKNQTPQSFFKDHVNYPISETLSLIHDPRNKPMALYTVQYLGNITGGRPIRYVNASIEDLKHLAIQKLKSGKPVWFGADVGKFMQRAAGVLDPKVFQYDLAFNVTFNMTKAERLIYGESMITHAMVFTGVHLDDEGKAVRWRVENSWGSIGGDQGYVSMSDAWFTEFVYQVVLEKSIVPQKFLDVLQQPVHVFPAYDPMGALA